MELMICHEGIKIERGYYVVRMGQVCKVLKWIYFRFIAIYIGFMARIHFLP